MIHVCKIFVKAKKFNNDDKTKTLYYKNYVISCDIEIQNNLTTTSNSGHTTQQVLILIPVFLFSFNCMFKKCIYFTSNESFRYIKTCFSELNICNHK